MIRLQLKLFQSRISLTLKLFQFHDKIAQDLFPLAVGILISPQVKFHSSQTFPLQLKLFQSRICEFANAIYCFFYSSNAIYCPFYSANATIRLQPCEYSFHFILVSLVALKLISQWNMAVYRHVNNA